MSSISQTKTLNNGLEMPALGLGVYQIPKGLQTEQAVLWALEAGYRHIDTASFYGNEADVGRAIRKSGIQREEIFVTTKLWPTDFWRAEAAFQASLEKLGFEYLDLYLIHWPLPIGKGHAWNVLERLYKRGVVKAIGVSNYSIRDLTQLLKTADVLPTVNQVEFSPFLYRKELLDYCQSQHIQLEAYSPLTRGKRLYDPAIDQLAKRYQKTPAQLMISWSLQHGLVVIPKSSNQARIKENAQVFDFEISQTDMEYLDGLNENYRALFR
ncbi:aldo/keto reductase [Patescibacteria group bacterium]|nr:aldo/keto reductase [Patescibacteria group bacterium]